MRVRVRVLGSISPPTVARRAPGFMTGSPGSRCGMATTTLPGVSRGSVHMVRVKVSVRVKVRVRIRVRIRVRVRINISTKIHQGT